MTAAPDFKQTQYEFAAHIRDPATQPAPSGIEDRRLKIYRDLFFNNISSLMAQTFPVLHALLSEEKWQRLMRSFFSQHHCHTPLFTKLPAEFLAWLSNQREAEADDPRFMLELAHYEWVELALSLAEDVVLEQDIDRYGDLLNAAPVLSALAWPLSYRFPVQQIGPDYQPNEAPSQSTCLLVYRNREDEVGFIETNAITMQLVDSLKNNLAQRQTGAEILQGLAQQFPQLSVEAIQAGGLQTLEQLRQKDIILGTLAE